jgi:uncharacterized membrane protein YfhO
VVLPDDSGLLIADRYDSRWRAFIRADDGTKQEIEIQNFRHMRLLQLPAGTHQLQLDYFPQELGISVAISLGTVIAGGLLAARQQNTRSI